MIFLLLSCVFVLIADALQIQVCSFQVCKVLGKVKVSNDIVLKLLKKEASISLENGYSTTIFILRLPKNLPYLGITFGSPSLSFAVA